MSKLGKLIRDINEDGYEDGVNGAGHPASIEKWKDEFKIEKWKDEFKEIIQGLIDETFTDNDSLAYDFWKKVEKL